MNAGTIIPQPVLDNRSEQFRIVVGMLRTASQLSMADAEFGIQLYKELKAYLSSGRPLPPQTLGEITGLAPGSPQYVLVSELTRICTEMLFRINVVPNKVRIALCNLLDTYLLPAVAATCQLSFSTLSGSSAFIPSGSPVNLGGTQVLTLAPLTVAAGATGTVGAVASTPGAIPRVPAGTAGALQSSIAGVAGITNTTDLIGGRNGETVEQAEIRARETMRIGEHLGSADDYVTYIMEEILLGAGRVTVFEDYLANFNKGRLGHVLVVVQSDGGLAPDTTTLQEIQGVIDQKHIAGTQVVASAPQFVSFSILANLAITPNNVSATQSSLIAEAVANLKSWFNPLTFPYGVNAGQRYIRLADVVGAITSAGPNQITVQDTAGLFQITFVVTNPDQSTTNYNQDIPLTLGQLPLLTGFSYSLDGGNTYQVGF